MEEVDAAKWVLDIRPASHRSGVSGWQESAVSPRRLVERVTRLVGEGPVQWAIQSGITITNALLQRFPAWATSGDEHRLCRVGPESIALVSLEFLATGQFSSGSIGSAVAHVGQANNSRIPLSELLQASVDVQAHLEREYFTVSARHISQEQYLEAARSISWAVLICLREYTDSLASTRAGDRGHTQSEAETKRHLVGELLKVIELGAVADVERAIGYGVTGRKHHALIASADPDQPDAVRRMRTYVSRLAQGPDHNRVLDVDRSTAGEYWLWWERSDPHFDQLLSQRPVPKGVSVATASVGDGLAGFRASHERAIEVRRAMAAFAFSLHRVVDYQEVAGVLPFADDLPRAAEFAVEELGRLAARDATRDAERLTLATQLRTQSFTDTARELFISRSTVTYRLQKAATSLPAGWKERPMEVALALRLVNLLAPIHIEVALAKIAPAAPIRLNFSKAG